MPFLINSLNKVTMIYIIFWLLRGLNKLDHRTFSFLYYLHNQDIHKMMLKQFLIFQFKVYDWIIFILTFFLFLSLSLFIYLHIYTKSINIIINNLFEPWPIFIFLLTFIIFKLQTKTKLSSHYICNKIIKHFCFIY